MQNRRGDETGTFWDARAFAGTRDFGWATQPATAPFRFFQRRFDPGRGPGLFALAAPI